MMEIKVDWYLSESRWMVGIGRQINNKLAPEVQI